MASLEATPNYPNQVEPIETVVHRIINSLSQHKICTDEKNDHIYIATNTQQMLDDFLHLLTFYDTPKQIEIIRNSLGGYCDANKCAIFARHMHYRNRNTTDANETTAFQIQITDKIHCYYRHRHKHDKSNRDDRYILRFYEEEKKHDVEQKNNINFFSVGKLFKYKCEYANSNDEDIISPRYQSLKEELINNEICVEQYDSEYKKMKYHFESRHKKIYYPNITQENILCLMIYCNFDTLQHLFSKTYYSEQYLKK
eukprot:352189_1